MPFFILLGVLSTIGLCIPLFVMLRYKIAAYKTFPALFFYLLLGILSNILILIPASNKIIVLEGFISNFLDAPLILLFLGYFITNSYQKKWLLYLAGALVLFQLIILAVFGYSKASLTYFIPPGLLLVLGLTVYFFVKEVKNKDGLQVSFGRILIAAGLVLAYSGYLFLYAGFYLFETPYKSDARLIYFLFTFICYIAIGVGIFMERKQIEHDIEIRRSEEELRALYGDEEQKKAGDKTPAASFNVSKSSWN